MSLIDYEKLQIIETFKNLKRDDHVYSKKYGLGTVVNFHNEEVIVAFEGYRGRFSEEEIELRKLPENWLTKRRHKMKIEENGQQTTLRELKRKRKLEKELAKIINK